MSDDTTEAPRCENCGEDLAEAAPGVWFHDDSGTVFCWDRRFPCADCLESGERCPHISASPGRSASVSAAVSSSTGEADTRAAVARAIHECDMEGNDKDSQWAFEDQHPPYLSLADAAVAAFLAHPPQWLKDMVRAVDAYWCDRPDNHCEWCSAVPSIVRAAAGVGDPS